MIYYQDEAVTLYHGDCREILPQLGPVDHVITDPPYEADAHTKGRRVKRMGIEPQDKWAFIDKSGTPRYETLPFPAITAEERMLMSAETARLTKRWALVFCQAEAAHEWERALMSAGMSRRRWCVWVKPDGQPQFSGDRPGVGYETIVACHANGASRWNGGGKCGVFTYCRQSDRGLTPIAGGAPHPTTKPEPLMCELIALFTDPHETILDPFAGSGTTLIAAKRLGRKAIGVELEEKYCEIAARRCAQGSLLMPEGLEPRAGRSMWEESDGAA